MQKLTFVIILLLLLPGCSGKNNINENNFKIEIPLNNEYDLKEVWSVKLAEQQSDYDIEDNILYVVTEGNVITTININNGELLNEFSISNVDFEHSSGVSVDNGIIAVNFYNEVVVFDTNIGREVYRYKASEEPIVAIQYQILVYENVLILSNKVDHKIHAIDIITGNQLWEKGGDLTEHGALTLYKFKDKLIYSKGTENAYYEINPLNGEAKDVYEYSLKTEIKNENQDAYVPEFDGIEDDLFRTWLIGRSFDVFNQTSKNYIYTTYDNKFYFHGVDGNLQWVAELPKDIWITEGYGRYVILNLYDQVSILDLETKKIIWNINYEIASKPRSFVHEDKLFLPGADGSYKVFDLRQLIK